MDPGTLLGTISLGIQVSQGIVDYCNSFRGYNNETDALISSSDCLKKNLETIEEVMKRSTFHESPELKKVRDQLKNNVASSFEAIRALKAEYENLRPNSSHLTAKITMQNFARKAAWHFRKQSLPRLQRTVSDALRNLEIGVNTYQLDQIGFIRNVANQMKNQQKAENIRNWLAAPDHTIRHKNARERRQDGTALWIFDEPSIQNWLTQSGVLWLTGSAGSGKTVLSSAVIEKVKADVSSKVDCVVAFFHFAFNDSVNGTAEMFARSLIHQLSPTSSYPTVALESLYQTCQVRKDVPTLQQLTHVLNDLIGSFEDVFIILDALDEAPQKLELWKVLKILTGAAADNVHLFLTSRPNIDSEMELLGVHPLRVQMKAEHVSADILIVIQDRLRNDPKLSKFHKFHEKIEISISNKADGMFLLADSQLSDLRRCATLRQLNQSLDTLSGDLDHQWQRCFDNIRSGPFASQAVRMLTWLCFSQRPMASHELIDALAVPEDWCEDFDPDLDRIADVSQLLEICSDLVERDEVQINGSEDHYETIYRLAHSSVRDWLQADRTSERNFSNASPFETIKAHGRIAQDCIQYLIYFGKEHDWNNEHQHSYPLAKYAANFWGLHLNRSEFSQESIQGACKLLINDEIRLSWRCVLAEKQHPALENLPKKHRGVPLAYASEMGLDPVVQHLLEIPGANVNESGAWKSALELAVENDSLSTLKILVNGGANVNAVMFSRKHHTIFLRACQLNSLETVTYLLEQGAKDRETLSKEEPFSALLLASLREDDAITCLLLSRGFEVDRRDGFYERTALHAAAWNLGLSNVRTLLNYGADKSIVDCDGALPLHLAVLERGCSLELAELLHSDGFESIKDINGDIPLYCAIGGNKFVCDMLIERTSGLQLSKLESTRALVKAAERGFLNVIKFLCEKGATFEQNGHSALVRAATNGHLDIVEFLLDQGESVDVLGPKQTTSFLCAIKEGHGTIWRRLAERGADIHAVDVKQTNACHLAAMKNDVEALEWLLGRGANCEQHDQTGKTPVHLASIEGAFEALKVLIQKGADINKSDHMQARAPHFAAASGHLEILQWLTRQGVDMAKADKDGITPFLDAVRYRQLDCVKFLAEHTTNHKTERPEDGWSLLSIAVAGGCVDIAAWMIENGADLNEQFDVGESPFAKNRFTLLGAISSENFEMTKLLLEKGADPNLCTKHGTTPLLSAAEACPISYLSLLVEYHAKWQNVQDGDGDNMLLLACVNPDPEVLRWCIAHSFNVNVMNKYGFSPMLKVALLNRVVHGRLLRKAGCVCDTTINENNDKGSVDDFRETSIWFAIRALKSCTERLNVHDRYTPLMASAFRGHIEAVEFFFTEFPEIRMCLDKDGNDALAYACCAGHTNIVEYLIKNGFNTERANKAGRTVVEETENFFKCLRQDVRCKEDNENDNKICYNEKQEDGKEVKERQEEDKEKREGDEEPEEEEEEKEEENEEGDEEEEIEMTRDDNDESRFDAENWKLQLGIVAVLKSLKGPRILDNCHDAEGSGNYKDGTGKECYTPARVENDCDDESDKSESSDVFFPARSRQGTELFEDPAVDPNLSTRPSNLSQDTFDGHDIGNDMAQQSPGVHTVEKGIKRMSLERRVNTL